MGGAINGEGLFGTKHTWRNDGTPCNGITHYSCPCGQLFTHQYNRIPNIFDAMKEYGVKEDCPLNKEAVNDRVPTQSNQMVH